MDCNISVIIILLKILLIQLTHLIIYGMAFLANYERPLDPNQPSRGTQAQEWYEFLGGIIPPTPSRTKRKKYPWAVMTNKIRQKRLI
nr:MAG TPA: Morphogenesis protein 1 wall, phi29, hydrolase, infection [Caudoviricetes sp.]